MCGIFGVIHNDKGQLEKAKLNNVVNRLFQLSETRGKDSAGIVIRDMSTGVIEVLKRDVNASKFIRTKEYTNFFDSITKNIYEAKKPLALFGHSRLVTNGSQEDNGNNQPIIKEGVIAVHNGIITNVDELWKGVRSEFNRENEVDTEVLLALIRSNLKKEMGIKEAVRIAYGAIEGAASIAAQFSDSNNVVLATNTGSLYYVCDKEKNTLIFASEAHILEELLKQTKLAKFSVEDISWLNPSTGLVIDLNTFVIESFDLKKENSNDVRASLKIEMKINNRYDGKATPSKLVQYSSIAGVDKFFEFNINAISQLKRCTKCILPETFPFIEFDIAGVCNFCNNFVPHQQDKTKEEFVEILERYKKLKPKGPNVIVPLSGGRDSIYGLHLLVKEFGMNPVTFTYDWGMVTDLARRNIARITGQLGVENIVVSADIAKKRKYIRQNIKAWLKKPNLGIIPLFMAGDKYFFRIVNQIKKDTGIKIDIWSGNKYENTDFKVGFCGVPPEFGKERIDELGWRSKLKLPMYYGRKYFFNPSYFNSSLLDTIGAFQAYYLEPRNDYYLIFDYLSWNEKEVEKIIIDEYNFELSDDSPSTWRIGDGTASFYNYIYYTVAGFTEYDTFRSNQIRDGKMSREEALKLVNEENKPRIESFLWYFQTIDVDPVEALKVINDIPKLYNF